MSTRVESDSLGTVEVPAAHLWGAQTQRALHHFSIGDDRMPLAVYHAYGSIKKAAAVVNERAGLLSPEIAGWIVRAAEEVISGSLDEEFPLSLWQSGSGTQTNMNVNEVIANRAIQLAGGQPGTRSPVHPNDHVNRSQSSNDTFPTAMHLAAVAEISGHLLPAIRRLNEGIKRKAAEWNTVVKIGRTHLQDAVPLMVGQEWSGYGAQLDDASDRVAQSLPGLYRLAIGGTAVGTGLNAPAGFGEAMALELATLTGYPFEKAPNKFAALASLDAIVAAMGALRGLAVVLFKIANDIRWLASGPRCGLGELILPANEPGSSIMPGKVNPSQCEAMMMVATQVLGHDATVAWAGSQGNLELNTMRPVVIHALLHSCRILAGASVSFERFCVREIRLDDKRIAAHLEQSLMLVTALTPVIGYDPAAALAKLAYEENLTLRKANRKLGLLPEAEFDRLVRPDAMTHPKELPEGS